MKRIAVSAIVAGGLFLGALGAAGAAQATEFHVGPDGAGITAVDGSGIAVGPNGVQVWLPEANNDYATNDYANNNHYDGRYRYDYYHDGRHPYYEHPYGGCYAGYCGR